MRLSRYLSYKCACLRSPAVAIACFARAAYIMNATFTTLRRKARLLNFTPSPPHPPPRKNEEREGRHKNSGEKLPKRERKREKNLKKHKQKNIALFSPCPFFPSRIFFRPAQQSCAHVTGWSDSSGQNGQVLALGSNEHGYQILWF